MTFPGPIQSLWDNCFLVGVEYHFNSLLELFCMFKLRHHYLAVLRADLGLLPLDLMIEILEPCQDVLDQVLGLEICTFVTEKALEVICELKLHNERIVAADHLFLALPAASEQVTQQSFTEVFPSLLANFDHDLGTNEDSLNDLS